jgi:hypothetical protein
MNNILNSVWGGGGGGTPTSWLQVLWINPHACIGSHIICVLGQIRAWPIVMSKSIQSQQNFTNFVLYVFGDIIYLAIKNLKYKNTLSPQKLYLIWYFTYFEIYYI